MKEMIIKVCIAGEGGTGKTTLLHRLIEGKFIADMKMTIGTGLMTYQVTVKDIRIVFQLWDFAGEERFRFFLPAYLKGAKSVLLCYDTTRFTTFQNLDEWYSIVENVLDVNNVLIYLIGTKIDLTDKRSVNKDVIDDFLKLKKFDRYFETSSKTGENIKEIFQQLAEDVFEKQKEEITKGNIVL